MYFIKNPSDVRQNILAFEGFLFEKSAELKNAQKQKMNFCKAVRDTICCLPFAEKLIIVKDTIVKHRRKAAPVRQFLPFPSGKG